MDAVRLAAPVRVGASETEESAWTSTKRRSGGHDRPSLVAVKVTDPRQDESVFEVTVGTIRVTVPLGFDEVELARLLKVVASCGVGA